MDMNAEALSYYWHLRAQGISPNASSDHVRQRFGVTIGRVIPADACVFAAPEPEFKPELPDWVKNNETIFGTSSTPQRS